jgi:hypothetical protein
MPIWKRRSGGFKFSKCKQVKVPETWDCPLPSDVALKLPGLDEPTILLSSEAEVRQGGYDRQNGHSVIFCSKLPKSHEHLKARAGNPGAIENSRGTQFFNVRDPEGNVIEICKEPSREGAGLLDCIKR